MTQLVMPKMHKVGRIYPGDIVFVGNRLMRINVTRKLKEGHGPQAIREENALWEGKAHRTGKTLRFFKRTVRMKSPMSPMRPSMNPRSQKIGLHADCGGIVYYTPSRRIGDRFCDKCHADGRFNRPRPILDSEVNPIGRKNAD
jgi:hypothetical protein